MRVRVRRRRRNSTRRCSAWRPCSPLRGSCNKTTSKESYCLKKNYGVYPPWRLVRGRQLPNAWGTYRRRNSCAAPHQSMATARRPSMEEALLDCDDVAALDPLDENAVVSFIGARYSEAPVGQPPKHHLIYTRAGPIIVALNPLSPVLDLYTPAQRARYSKAASERARAEKESRVIDDSDLPPHVYEVSARTYCGVRDGRSQAVVINGESGAGKTETAKILLQDRSLTRTRTRVPTLAPTLTLALTLALTVTLALTLTLTRSRASSPSASGRSSRSEGL